MNLFILRWNPNISSFTMEDFEKLVHHTDKMAQRAVLRCLGKKIGNSHFVFPDI